MNVDPRALAAEAAQKLDTGDLSGAEAAARAVPRGAGFDAPMDYVLATVAFHRKDYAGARDLFRRAVDINPGLGAAYTGLGNALYQLGDLEGAAEGFRRTLSMNPRDADALNNLGDVLQKQGRFPEAQVSYEGAMEARPGWITPIFNRATALQHRGEFEAALAGFQAVVHADPGHIRAYNGIQTCGLRLRRPEIVLEACEGCRRAKPDNQFSIAHEAFARMQLRDEAGFDRLYDLSMFPIPMQLELPQGYPDLDTFNRSLEREILEHPDLYWHHGDAHRTTPRGFNYGLQANPTPAFSAFEAALRQTVGLYMADLEPLAGHPFLGARPDAFDLEIWATVLSDGGIHPAHSHEDAWVSGVYYCATGALEQDGDSDQPGWIVFDGFSEFTDDGRFRAKVRAEQPREGRMFLFPSYFLHQTRAFSCRDGYRISVAFDVQPR